MLQRILDGAYAIVVYATLAYAKLAYEHVAYATDQKDLKWIPHTNQIFIELGLFKLNNSF